MTSMSDCTSPLGSVCMDSACPLHHGRPALTAPSGPPPGYQRPTWDDHWMQHARVAAGRAACSRRQVGAVIVVPTATGTPWMVAEGYNGAPPGAVECIDGGCPRGRMSYGEVEAGSSYDNCISVHAEVNAITSAARRGVSTEGGTLYVTDPPCNWCAKVVKAAGIGRVVIGDQLEEWNV